MKIHFHGAARQVTGSKHLLEIAGKRILLDCGFFQGRRQESFQKNHTLPFDAKQIDAVILSHAHIDHCGSLPVLVKNGFSGKIFLSFATAQIAALMLADSAFIQEKDAEYFSRKLAKTKLPIDPLYSQGDVERTINLFAPKKLHERFEILPGIFATFFDAGHVLGSQITQIEFSENGRQRKVIFTGDLGRKNRSILRDPEILHSGEILITESTYGNRNHPDNSHNRDELARVVNEAVQRGGKIIVPSFALERTQEIVFDLQILKNEKKIGAIPLIIDSPLATRLTEVFKERTEFFDAESHREFLAKGKNPFENVAFTRTVEESKAINFRKEPCIVISASGMCEAGRIRHHLRNSISNETNTILIVGFQAAHTLGRKLVEGAREVKIFDEMLPVRAKVEIMNGFSGHAGKDDLLQFATAIKDLRQIFVVHGEETEASAFAQNLQKENSNWQVQVPCENEIFEV